MTFSAGKASERPCPSSTYAAFKLANTSCVVISPLSSRHNGLPAGPNLVSGISASPFLEDCATRVLKVNPVGFIYLLSRGARFYAHNPGSIYDVSLANVSLDSSLSLSLPLHCFRRSGFSVVATWESICDDSSTTRPMMVTQARSPC